jgi:hypothetical protein
MDLETALTRRAWRLALVVPIVLVAGAGLLRSAWPLLVPRTPPSIVAPTPAPVPVAVTSDVTFGTLSLNGHRLHVPPPQTITLRQGVNILTLSAPPFPTRSCAILGPVPDAGSGPSFKDAPTCGVSTSSDDTGASSYTISLTLSGDDLSPALRADARAAIAQALAARPPWTETVPTGEYIVSGTDRLGIPTATPAPAPLTASLALVLVTTPGTGPSTGACPSLLCEGDTMDPAQPIPYPAWNVDVPVALDWRFTTGAGRVVAMPILPATNSILIELAYTGGHWQVVVGTPDAPGLDPSLALDPCTQATYLLTEVIGFNAQGASIQFGGGNAVPTNPMDGCDIDATPQDGGVTAHYIYRFGVLLAADAAAHRLTPHLPIAPSAEVIAVSR